VKKRFSLIAIPLIAVLAFALSFSSYPLLVYAAGTPDAYGNQIYYLRVYQWSGAAWIQQGETVGFNNYTAGFQIRVNANQDVLFNCTVKLNYTMAANIAEAVTNTRVYMNVSGGVWVNELLDDWNDGGIDQATWWSVTYSNEWDAGSSGGDANPQAGTTYDISVRYEAYY